MVEPLMVSQTEQQGNNGNQNDYVKRAGTAKFDVQKRNLS
jgi:hypothetical protein